MASRLAQIAATLSAVARKAAETLRQVRGAASVVGGATSGGLSGVPPKVKPVPTPLPARLPKVKPVPIPLPLQRPVPDPHRKDDQAGDSEHVSERWRRQGGRVDPNDPVLTGEMIRVSSSNVHSIGFQVDQGTGSPVGTKGSLFVRFLGGHGKERSGPGAMYEYLDVPTQLFRSFLRAASKGKFLWDEVRVRGTASGHRYRYDLIDVVNDYVPRQAGLKRGQPGEWYMTRRFRTATGRVLVSRLPEEKVRTSGPNPVAGPGVGKLILKRGKPNRGNRGRPNRGTGG